MSKETVNKKSSVPFTPEKYKVTFYFWETSEEMAREAVEYALRQTYKNNIKKNPIIKVEEVKA